MLDDRCVGPYTGSKAIDRNAYKTDPPETMQNHGELQESKLDLYKPPASDQPSSELHPMIIDDSEECGVDHILDCQWWYQKLHYVVQWAGYGYIPTTSAKCIVVTTSLQECLRECGV